MNQFGIPYQLPSFYKREVIKKREAVKKTENPKHIHRLFIFLETTEADIKVVATEAASCQRLDLLELQFEKGITDADRVRYIAIFEKAMPADRAVEIAAEANIPSTEIRERYQNLQYTAIRQEVASIRREALLN